MALIDLNQLALPDLYAHLESTGLVRRLLELARDEDLGPDRAGGDVTSGSMPEPRRRITAGLYAREPCVVSGLAAVPEMLRVFDPSGSIEFTARHSDGWHAPRGKCLGVMAGPLETVLAVERTLLNLVSRLSGVATLTIAFADRIAFEAPASPARVYDTRKTTPGLRVLEKYAVRCGGGFSHRLGLHDAVLIKDNHIAGVPVDQLGERVRAAAEAARLRAARGLRFVEVEVDSLDQFRALLAIPPRRDGTRLIDIVLLDNMGVAQLREAVALRDAASASGCPRVELEASGGVRLETVGAIAGTGVDRVSCGALTHQAVSVDIGLDIRDGA